MSGIPDGLLQSISPPKITDMPKAMAPKQVYGKRQKFASAFAMSANFSWSSPSKEGNHTRCTSVTSENDAEITVTTLKSLGAAERDQHTPIKARTRRALTQKDSNVRLQASGAPESKVMPNLKRKIIAAKVEPAPEDRRHSSTDEAFPTPPPSERHDSTGSAAGIAIAHVEDDYLGELLSLCSDSSSTRSPRPFEAWSATLEPYFSIVKIAEASYGEVYRLCLRQHHPGFKPSDESVLKILPLKPPPSAKKKSAVQKRKEEQMSDAAGVASEVKLLQRMTAVPGFTNFRGVVVLKGRPSEVFVDAWKDFNKRQPKGAKSLFPDPSKKASYTDEQLWAVVEMQDAGIDLEHVELRTVWEVWDVFWGVALALAKGEEEARFEHRDLHLGNICVQSRRRDEKVGETKIRNVKGKRVGFTGLETTLIDYTLSRAEMDSAEEIAFLDLEQLEWLFEQDASEEYQYEIYRLMRKAVIEKRPTGVNDLSDLATALDSRASVPELGVQSWRHFCPLTNTIWLHYVLRTLLRTLDNSREDQDAITHRLGAGGDVHSAETTQAHLNDAIRQLDAMLSVESRGLVDTLTSARDLVAVALEEGWLEAADVVEHTGTLPTPKKTPRRGSLSNGCHK